MTITPWKAHAPDLSTVAEVRKLRFCEHCSCGGTSLMVIAAPARRGKPGRYAHGYCYAKANGLDALAALAHEELNKLTLDEMTALGFKGRAGYLRFDRIYKAARRRAS